MCGRYTLYSDLSELQAEFKFEGPDAESRASYNVAPTQQSLVVTNDGSRRGEFIALGPGSLLG